MAAALIFIVPWAAWQFGLSGMAAAGLAAWICWVGSALALVVAQLLRGPNLALQCMLFSLVLRTGIPLGFAVVVQTSGLLTRAGLVYYLLFFYLVALGVEVLLSLPEITRPGIKPPKSGTN